MNKTDRLFNRIIERNLFKRRHESRIRFVARRAVEEVGPYLLGVGIGVAMVLFVFFGI